MSLVFLSGQEISDDEITVRHPEERDIESLRYLYGKAMRYEEAETMVKLYKHSYENRNEVTLCVEWQGETAGIISIFNIHEKDCQIAFRTIPSYMHKHIMRKAVYLITRHLIEEGMEEIHAKAEWDNDAAIHILDHDGYAWLNTEDGFRTYLYTGKDLTKEDYRPKENEAVLYMAGGCFWGMEKAVRQLEGVISTFCGYANGNYAHPTYEDVCRGDTGFREAVRVIYDPSQLSLNKLLTAYFMCIHPEQEDGQGNDIGSQYLTGVYYTDKKDEPVIRSFFEEEEKKHHAFHTEYGPIRSFFVAEDYHQLYLDKHPDGYCHISFDIFDKIKALNEEDL